MKTFQLYWDILVMKTACGKNPYMIKWRCGCVADFERKLFKSCAKHHKKLHEEVKGKRFDWKVI